MTIAALTLGAILIVAIFDARDATETNSVPIKEWWKIRSYMEDPGIRSV